jgi:hypothetical protein
MDVDHEKRIVELEIMVRTLQNLIHKEFAVITKRIDNCEGGTEAYIDKHVVEHIELSRLIWASYSKTHPGYVETLVAASNIIGEISTDGSDPQP